MLKAECPRNFTSVLADSLGLILPLARSHLWVKVNPNFSVIRLHQKKKTFKVSNLNCIKHRLKNTLKINPSHCSFHPPFSSFIHTIISFIRGFFLSYLAKSFFFFSFLFLSFSPSSFPNFRSLKLGFGRFLPFLSCTTLLIYLQFDGAFFLLWASILEFFF